MGCSQSTVKPSSVPIATSVVVPERTSLSMAPPAKPVLAVEDQDQLNLPPGTCVIAIDFGTSRSAFAYGFTGSTEVNFGCPTDSLLNEGVAVKAETCVILDNHMKAIGFGLKGRKTLYAQKKENDSHMFKWFKMHLKDIKSDSDESIMIEDHNGKKFSLMTVITQALYYIAKSALDEVNAKSLSTKSMHDVYWAVTVPAIWSAAASGFMRRAAHKAGLIDSQLSLKLTLVREPEAACLDLLNDIDKKSHPVQIPVGAEIVVLDLGGGTNDMTFVKILSEDPLNCQELKEAAGGTGGAARIDQSVLVLLKELFGDRLFKKVEKLPALLDLLDSWETFKLTFDGHMTYAMKLGDLIDALQEEHPEEVIYVEVINKMVADYNLHRPPSERLSNVRLKVDIPEAVVRKWFDSVVDVIISDLDTQLRHPACSRINFLYLVGGFSSSKYLTQKVTDHCKTSTRYKNITIFPATKPDVAIVRGAVRSLLSMKKPLIADHVASKAYGIQTTTVFDPKVHDRSKIVTLEGKERVRIFDIFVCKGDRIPLNYVTPENSYTPLSADQENVFLKLYTLAEGGLTINSLVYMDDPRLKLEHSLKVPMNKSVPFEDREVKVKLKFGLETQILARDERNKFYENATLDSFV